MLRLLHYFLKNVFFVRKLECYDYDMRLYAWENILPYYFALNKVNYARYGTYYVETLKQIDIRYPGLKPIVGKKGNVCTGSNSVSSSNCY